MEPFTFQRIGTTNNARITGVTRPYLTHIWLPRSLRIIDQRAFQGTRSLYSISLPEGLQEIWSNALRDARSLASIHIPDSVVNIGAEAFHGASNLREVYVASSIPARINATSFSETQSLRAVYIPIGSYINYRNSGWSMLGSLLRYRGVETNVLNRTIPMNTFFYRGGILGDITIQPSFTGYVEIRLDVSDFMQGAMYSRTTVRDLTTDTEKALVLVSGQGIITATFFTTAFNAYRIDILVSYFVQLLNTPAANPYIPLTVTRL